MTNFNLQENGGDDMLDVRDIIGRLKELEAELKMAKDGQSVYAEKMTLDAYIAGVSIKDHPFMDEINEYVILRDFLAELKGQGGDEQWRGDWYPVTLIRDSYFEDAMDQMLEDCGDLKPYAERPSYIKIKIDYDALKMDYASAELDGVTYWMR